MTCRSCGAEAPAGSGLFCSHCGRVMGDAQALPVAIARVDGAAPVAALATTTAGALAAPPTPYAERFAAARRDPAFSAALAERVTADPSARNRQAVTFAGLGVVGFLLIGVTSGSYGASFAQVATAIWCVLLALGFFRLFSPAPHRRELAYVITRASFAAQTQELTVLTLPSAPVVLELEDGRRLAAPGEVNVVAGLVPGDCGVAHFQGERLVGFRRLAG